MATILVVDDEAMIRDLARRILAKNGHEVISAESAQEAQATFAQHAGIISAIILDYSLPDVSGIDLLVQFRAVRPDVPCLISSGFALAQSDIPPDLRPHTSFLQKPYRAAQLLEAVQSAITPIPRH